jgi:hypothetical protein
MPLLDVLLYHGLGPSRSAQPHYEPSGMHCHGELCKLDSSFPSSTEAESLDLRFRLTSPSRELPLAALAPRPANLELLPHPRAPPALPA